MVREVAELLNRLRREEVTMLVVTHDLALARMISERVVYLEQGIVRAEDNIDDLASMHSDPAVRAFFGAESGANRK
jgi:ABC-type polar amino acid transport system ATPase subunit